MRLFLISGLVVSLLAGPTYAKKYELPSANPAVTVSVPDSWSPEEMDTGAQATSPDGETFVMIETATAKKADELVKENIEALRKTGIVIDAKTQQQQDMTVNAMPVTMLEWKGNGKFGPNIVNLAIVGVTENLIVLMTTTSSPKGDTANGDALSAIMTSIKKR